VFENIHDDILLLNIPADEESFEQFLVAYDKINGNKSDNGSKVFQYYKEYYLNKLKTLKHVQIYLDNIFHESFSNVVKVQMKFCVILESQVLVMKINTIIIFNQRIMDLLPKCLFL
jgi:hypothetical protein